MPSKVARSGRRLAIRRRRRETKGHDLSTVRGGIPNPAPLVPPNQLAASIVTSASARVLRGQAGDQDIVVAVAEQVIGSLATDPSLCRNSMLDVWCHCSSWNTDVEQFV
jgi:hypothetical protein